MREELLISLDDLDQLSSSHSPSILSTPSLLQNTIPNVHMLSENPPGEQLSQPNGSMAFRLFPARLSRCIDPTIGTSGDLMGLGRSQSRGKW